MCKFFSLCSTGNGKPMYFDWELRKKVLAGELNYEPDSHTSIADYFGYKGTKEDALNKFEYNPFTKSFTVDQLNAKRDDSKKIEAFCNKVNFKTIVEPLIVSPIVNPFLDRKPPKIGEEHLSLLKSWVHVRAKLSSEWSSMGDSVRDSVRDSVWDLVGDSVWNSVRDSVRDSMGDSVWYSIWGLMRDSVWGLMRGLVWDSMLAYTSSKFKPPQCNKNPFQSCIDLWEMGLIPSFNGTVWRLHGGPKGKVLWEGEL